MTDHELEHEELAEQEADLLPDREPMSLTDTSSSGTESTAANPSDGAQAES